MISNLPLFYRIAAIDSKLTSSDLFEKRSASINLIVDKKDEEFIFNCIRLYLGINISNKDFVNSFVKTFTENDPTFLDGQTIENRILAGSIVSEAISRREDNMKIAVALLSGSFGINVEDILNFQIIQNAQDFLHNKAYHVRQPIDFELTSPKAPTINKEESPTPENILSHVRSSNSIVKNLIGQMEKQNKSFQHRFEVLEEESNIHWWLFRSFSLSQNCPVSELNPKEAIFILPLELINLFNRIPFPNNSRDFLNKILKDVIGHPAELSIRNAIKVIQSKLKNEIESMSLERYGNLAPINFAYHKASEFDFADDDIWGKNFEKHTSLKVDKEHKSLDISMQFLTEALLCKV